jgi:hypothetical protein
MKLSLLFQPRNPLFWLMLVLNALSLLLAWVVRNRPLNRWGMALVAAFAIGNAVVGVWLAWRLMREPAPHRTAADGSPESDTVL